MINFRILISAFLLLIALNATSQFADKKYYLVDSLALNEVLPEDRIELDSLIKMYHGAKHDTSKILSLYHLSRILDKSWVKYNNLLLTTTHSFLLGKTKSYIDKKFLNRYYGAALYGLNTYYSEQNMEDSSLKYLQLCIPVFTVADYKKGLAETNISLGVYYNRLGKMEESLKYYQKGLVLSEAIGNKKGIAKAYSAIGLVYRDLDQYEKALANCKKALAIWEELDKTDKMSETWNFIGTIYKWSKDTLSAEKAYLKSLELGIKQNNLYNISSAKLNLGIIFQDKKQYEKAIKNYEESIDGFRKIGNISGESFALNSLAITYNLSNQSNKALKYALESHKLCEQIGYPENLINSSHTLYDTYRRLGKYREAFDMQQYYYQMKDSVLNVENQKKTLTAQLEFENEKRLLEIKKVQENKNIMAAAEKKKQLIITISIVICLLITIVFTVFLFNRFKLIKKQKDIIEEQNHMVTEKNKEITDSITYAKRLQEAILPSFDDVKKHLPGSFIYYRPKDIVAGDFYWMESIKTNNAETDTILIAAADSTGHGVPGAMVSVVCSNALNRTVLEFGVKEPGKILDKTREIVLQTFTKSNKDVKDGMDISLVSIQKQASGKAIVKWAGANNPLWYTEGGILNEIKADKQPVGKTDDPKPFTTHTLELEPGSAIYIFTDGFADQFGGPKGKKFKYKPFGELLVSISGELPEVQSQKINLEFENWKKELEQVDDVCVIGIRI
jgi:serine phosphatase RsbU (regulator of sigma subunit)/tetratricopeptide (TPR) repeat protein